MPLLSEQDRQTVRDRLADIAHPVTILFFTQAIGAPDGVMATKQIVAEVASLNDRIGVEEVNLILDKARAAQYGIDQIPAIVLLRNGEDTRIRFLGAPAGYEFASLVEAMILAGTEDSGLSTESRTLIAARAAGPIEIKVFVTPTCPHCPRMVTLAHRMAVESPHVVATCVEATEFLDLAQKYRVTGVPKTIVEGTEVEILGAVPEHEFVNAVFGPVRVQGDGAQAS
jgi:glutaredoxin-like protein